MKKIIPILFCLLFVSGLSAERGKSTSPISVYVKAGPTNDVFLFGYKQGIGTRYQKGTHGIDFCLDAVNLSDLSKDLIFLTELQYLYFFQSNPSKPMYYAGLGPGLVISYVDLHNQEQTTSSPYYYHSINALVGTEWKVDSFLQPFVQLELNATAIPLLTISFGLKY